jgi:hypothetical protein
MDRKDNPSNDPARCTSGSCAWIDRDFGCHLTLRFIFDLPPGVWDVQVFSDEHNFNVSTPGGTETLQCKFDLNTDGAKVYSSPFDFVVHSPASSVVPPPKKSIKREGFLCRIDGDLTGNSHAVYTPAGKVHLRCQLPWF